MKYDLTVIIPTYNSGKYISKCIKSILKNTCKIQILVIDDGSTDDTLKRLNKFNQYIKVIKSKKNYGVSNARNKGIKEIQAKYFTFVDSDDDIEPYAYDELLNIMQKNNLDMCGFNYYEVNNKKIPSKYKYEDEILDNDKLISKILKDQISMIIWNKIYKTETYKDILFNEKLIINEDYEYTIRCISKTKKSLFINKYLYNYNKNNESLTNKYTCKQIKENNYIENIKQIKKIKKHKDYEYFIYNDNLKQIHLYSKCIDKNNRYKYLKENIRRHDLKKLLKYNINKAIKIEILIYLTSIKLHLFLFPIYKKIRDKQRGKIK